MPGRTKAVIVVAMSGLIAGCAGRDRMCSPGAYPARSVEFPGSGRVCVDDGDEPPAGYERFPPDQVPVYVDQDG